MTALVVFLGRKLVDRPAWYASFLKTGFVHCFLLLQAGDLWVKVDGQNGTVVVKSLGAIGSVEDVVLHYQQQGATVLTTSVNHSPIGFPFVARTCVGLAKAVLGIRSMALTPWQLYKYLEKA